MLSRFLTVLSDDEFTEVAEFHFGPDHVREEYLPELDDRRIPVQIHRAGVAGS